MHHRQLCIILKRIRVNRLNGYPLNIEGGRVHKREGSRHGAHHLRFKEATMKKIHSWGNDLIAASF